jgi:orotidine-5'-phosphate decarboxylase
LSFGDRLARAVTERQSQLALGLDPDPARLVRGAHEHAGDGSPAQRAARAVAAHCRELIAAAGPACVAVKLQLACFERLGAPGWAALADVAASAREAGLIVIADGKRGDVPHTAEAYGQALMGSTPTPWGEVHGLGADAVTANPLLGRDALAPIVAAARSSGGGVFVLVRTSNPGAAELQDDPPAGRAPLHLKLATLVRELGDEGPSRTGLTDVGAVVAATEPELLGRLREAMPRSIFLLPGVGAQGGRVELLAPAFAPGPAAALVAASRTIVDAALQAGAVDAARTAAEGLREATWRTAQAAR